MSGTSLGFLVAPERAIRRAPRRSDVTSLTAAGRGFEKSSPKSYDKQAISPRGDLMDVESAMREFFDAQDAWKPLFRSMMKNSGGDDDDNNNNNSPEDGSEQAAAMAWLVDDNDTQRAESVFEFHESSHPWQRLPAIPTKESDRTVLAEFLDATQTSLIEDIPVDESTEDDEHDLQFLEEGRRMLVCSRFHVISTVTEKKNEEQQQQPTNQARQAASEHLFAACWNELFHLYDENEADTGSVILVPGFEIADLRRFVDMNLQRPLQWLGLEETFEVTSLQRGGGAPAIRVIHKLSDMPTDLSDDPETADDNEDS